MPSLWQKFKHDIATGASSTFHGLNPIDNGQGWTSKPVNNPDPQSAVHQIGNLALGLGKSIAQPIVGASADWSQFWGNLGTKLAGGKPQTAQEFWGNDPVGRATLNISGPDTGTLHHFVSSVAQDALMAVPGLGEASPEASLAVRAGTKALTTAPVAGAFNVLSGTAQNAPVKDIPKEFGQGAIAGALLGPASEVAGPAISKTVSAVKNTPELIKSTTPLGEEGFAKVPGGKSGPIPEGDANLIKKSLESEAKVRPLAPDEKTLLKVANDNTGKTVKVVNDNPQTIKVYRGEGNDMVRPGTNLFGNGDYYATDKATAQKFGKVSSTNINVKPSEVLQINNQADLENLIHNAQKYALKQGLNDTQEAIPAWAKSKGFKVIQGNAADDPLAGLSVIDPTVFEKPVGPKTIKVTKAQPTPKVNTLTSQELEMGRALGMSDQQILEAKNAPNGLEANPTAAKQAKTVQVIKPGDSGMEKAINQYRKETGASRAIAEREVNRMLKESTSPDQTVSQFNYSDLSPREKALNAEKNPMHGQVGDAPVKVGDTKQPILNTHAKVARIQDLHNAAAESLAKLDSHDLSLADSLRGNDPAEVAAKAHNPTAFTDAADKLKQYNDFTQAAGNDLGQELGYRQRYGASMFFDQGEASKAGLEKYKSSLNETPGYGKTRTQTSYEDAAKFGAKRLHSNIIEDLNHDALRRTQDIARLTLARDLNKAFPNQISVGEIPRGWKQLDISYGDGLSAPKELAAELNKRAPATNTSKGWAMYDAANRGLKYAKLGGGTFHAVTTAGSVAGQQLTSGDLFKHPIQNLKVIAGTFSDAQHEANFSKYADEGSLNAARQSGVTLRPKEILGDVNVNWLDKAKGSRLNIIKDVHDMVFGRQIPEAKMMIYRQQMTKEFGDKLDWKNLTPDQLEYGRGIAKQVNRLGGINRLVDGTTPTQMKWLGRGVLATDFTEGKLGTLKAALSSGGPEGKIARQMVIGKTIVLGLPGVIALVASGKVDPTNPKELGTTLINQALDPEIPTGFKTKTGIPKTAKLPETFVSEFGRIVRPMFDSSQPDKGYGFEHWLTARLAAVPSTANQLRQNQDYYGNEVIAHDQQGNVDVKKTAGNLGLQAAPIPVVQGTKTATGQETPAEAVINTLGLRVTADKTDPRMKALAYAQGIEKKQDSKTAQAYNLIHGKQVDQYNAPLQTAVSDSMLKRYSQFINQPDLLNNVLATDKKIVDFQKKEGLPTDPFYDLSPDQQKTLLTINNRRITDAKDPIAKQMTKDNQGWLNQFYNDRNAYFQKAGFAPSSGDKQGPVVEFPRPSDQVSQKLSQLGNISDPAERAQYLSSNPDIGDYYTQYDAAVRKQHDYFHEPQYDSYPQASPALEKVMQEYSSLPKSKSAGNTDPATSGSRSAWIKAHPQEWSAMTDQWSKIAQYQLEQDSQTAQFEGQDYSAKGIKAIKSLAQDLGVGSSSSGYSSRGSNASYLLNKADFGSAGAAHKSTVKVKVPTVKVVARRGSGTVRTVKNKVKMV